MNSKRKIRKMAVEIKPSVRNIESQQRHEDNLRYVRSVPVSKEDVNASLRAHIKRYKELKGLIEGQVRRLKRRMMQRSERLVKGEVADLKVVSDATGKATSSEPLTDKSNRPPVRWTSSELPEGLREVFSNQPRNFNSKVDKRAAYLMRLGTSIPDSPWDYEPMKGEPERDPPIRRTVSALDSEKHDLRDLAQSSTVFRTTSRAKSEQDEIGDEGQRKAIAALTTEL